MIRHRTDGQVVTSAAQIDGALTGGLSMEQIAALVEARQAWRVLGRVDAATVNVHLLAALQSPTADEWDAIFVRRARSELSVPSPTVAR